MVRFSAATWVTILLATLCAYGLAAAFGREIVLDVPLFALVLGLAGLHAFYVRVRPAPVLAALLGTVAATAWSLAMIGFTAVAGLAAGAPLIDRALAACDAALGLDAGAVVAWIALRPALVWLLTVAYGVSIPLVFVTLVALVLARQEARAWRYCFCILGTGLACALLSALLPAVGAFVGLDVPPEVRARLPAHAGTYHLAAFGAYREGTARIIDLQHLEGVVTFPSFHVAMAIATAHAWRTMPRGATPMLLWNAVVAASTIPIGGHYFVDLWAGAALCAAFLVLTRERRPAADPTPSPVLRSA